MEQATENTGGLRWFKSSHSGSGGGDCVEVASDHNTVYVRDSKVADARSVLRIERGGWAAFVAFARG